MSKKYSKKQVEERFGSMAQDYVNSTSHSKGEDLELLVQMANPKPEWNMVDVATGGGHTALRFAPLVKRVVATDISIKMLNAAKTFIKGQGIDNVEFKVSDSEHLPFEADQFDLLTCRIAVHHFPNAQAFIKESHRVLKKSGLFLLQDHLLPENSSAGKSIDEFERLRDPSHIRGFSKQEWMRQIENAGLTVKNTLEVKKRHELIPWAKRQKCSDQTIKELIKMVQNARDEIVNWLEPANLLDDSISFVNHHLLVLAEK